jgi:hypothetical protein
LLHPGYRILKAQNVHGWQGTPVLETTDTTTPLSGATFLFFQILQGNTLPKTLIEPFRIKSVEPIRLTTRANLEHLGVQRAVPGRRHSRCRGWLSHVR